MPKFSNTVLELEESPIRKLSHIAQQKINEGITVHRLNIGQPDLDAPIEAMELLKTMNLKQLPYGTSEGSESFRQTMQAYYKKNNIDVQADEIMITTGASEGISFVINSICNPGDQLIIPEPFYVNYNGFALSYKAEVVPVFSSLEQNFCLPDIQEIESKINKKTKGILICNPSNPTGYLYSQEEIEKLGELALKHDIFLIVDEVYREFVFDENETHFSVLQLEELKEHAIMIDSVSKRYSLCGARVGAVVTRNKELRGMILKFAHLRLSPPHLAMAVSQAAMTTSEEYIKNAIDIYRKRKETMIRAFANIPHLRVSNPAGAFFCIVELPVDDAEHFSKWMIESFQYQGESVLLSPASGFYSNPSFGKKQIRVGFVLDEKRLERSVEIIAKGLEAYSSLNT